MGKLLEDIATFLTRHGMPPTRFGVLAVGDGNLVADLRAGSRSPRIDTVERIERFMREYNAAHGESASQEAAPAA
ncbi:hypothetical protein UFOVP326_99 [uncultured Caudovirales phage]|uniref:Uncharacterized protein n=1 Tax=uncultured Caudovirales phage TaxID=2100421 RepID=A0A6J5LY40_9CAUD|nr:hypothetical protein UFOVP326_99 [uncultured Caudovirales phage]